MFTYLKKIINNPYHIFLIMAKFNLLKWIPDKIYLRIMYRGSMGKKLNLEEPKSFNEKLQWLKINDRNPDYIKMVDKYNAKEYVRNKLGNEYVIKTYGVWDSFDEINFSTLPDKFVLKCTHDSGGIFIVKDKNILDKKIIKNKIEKNLKYNFYSYAREWIYKDIKPRIIAEEYLEDFDTKELRDYKFFSFNGKCELMFISTERQNTDTETKFDFFDMEGNHLKLVNIHPNAEKTPDLPVNFKKMKSLASVLSLGLPQVRVDFYEVNGKIYFGELTFAHGAGFEPFYPESWDYKLGSFINLEYVSKGNIK